MTNRASGTFTMTASGAIELSAHDTIVLLGTIVSSPDIREILSAVNDLTERMTNQLVDRDAAGLLTPQEATLLERARGMGYAESKD